MFSVRQITFLTLFFVPAAIFAQNNTYDYIVVGSGPGGGPLAANLAKAGQSVLLLEAGDDRGTALDQEIIGWAFLAFNDPAQRWDYFVKYHSDNAITLQNEHLTWRTGDGGFYVGTDPPPGAKELGMFYPRAGTLGGCSTHNAGVALLPSDSDWNEIAALTGDPSWSAENMLKYFIQLENDHTVPKGTPDHGFGGFLDISGNNDSFLKNQSQALALLQATAAAGFGEDSNQIWNLLHRDINNAIPDRDQQVGIFEAPAHMTTTGHRVDARNPVIAVLNATNPDGSKKYPLILRTESFVTKILFNTTRANSKVPRAIGVEFLAGKSMFSADPRFNASVKGTKMQAFARKEVIISGGVFNSPQLLKLSGIGPKDELKSFNISVILDLPGVGSNLQDNTESGLNTKAALNFTSLSPLCTFGFTPDDPCHSAWETGVGGGGPYAQAAVPDAIMFKSSVAAFNERDIFMWASPNAARGFWPLSAEAQPPADPPNTWSYSMVKMHVHGKLGTLNLTSNNPQDVPDINFRFYEDASGQLDLQAMAEGIEFGRKVVNSVPAPIGPFNETSPCPGNVPCDTKDYILKQTWSHHATSSCAIGAEDDPLAVLDSKFRVRGTKGLRVVDGSAFPRPPGAFPVLPTFMLSLKATDAILADCDRW